jgi:DNA polymerase-3 subunit epsilon
MGHDIRQVVLDTETTGFALAGGHRIVEIGCVELVNRRATSRYFHCYLNPERPVERDAFAVHGIGDAFLAAQPRFADVAEEFIGFVRGSELVIHNAGFDVEFIDNELARLGGMPQQIGDCCDILDTLAMARHMHPGKGNSLDALATRYKVGTSERELHGALLDAQILAEVYLAMTGGQVSLSLEDEAQPVAAQRLNVFGIERKRLPLPVLRASAEECAAHEAMLERMRSKTGRATAWERFGHFPRSKNAEIV